MKYKVISCRLGGNSVANVGFSTESANIQGGANLLFDQFSRKLHENE